MEKSYNRVILKKIKGNKHIEEIVGSGFKYREIHTSGNTYAIIVYPEKRCYCDPKKFKTIEFTDCDKARRNFKEHYKEYYKYGACLFTWGYNESKKLYCVEESDIKSGYYNRLNPDLWLKDNDLSVEYIDIFKELIKKGHNKEIVGILEYYFDMFVNLMSELDKSNYKINGLSKQIEHKEDEIRDIKWLVSPYDSIEGRIDRERFIAQARKIEVEPSGWSRNTYMLRYEDQRELEDMGHHGNITMNP